MNVVAGGKFAIEHVPLELRQIIAAESAANDGLAYPFLTIALYVTVESTTRAAIGKWFLVGWLCSCSSSYTIIFAADTLDMPFRSSHSRHGDRCSHR